MADVSTILQALGAGGLGSGLILGIGRFIEGRTKRADDSQDTALRSLQQQVTGLEKRNAVLEAENTRLHGVVTRQERRIEKFEEDEKRMAGTLGRMRMDSSIDETEYEETMPTAVRNMADLIAPKSLTPPAMHGPAPTDGKKLLPPRAGHYGADTIDVDGITPTQLAPPMTGRGRIVEPTRRKP